MVLYLSCYGENFVSTLHRAEGTGEEPVTVKRRQADGSRIDIPCPPLLPDYQAFMRGVDRSDQMIGFYNIGRRSKKWWKRAFSHIIECAILNAYVLDSHVHPLEHALRGRKKRDYLSFRLQLAEELIGSFLVPGRELDEDDLVSIQIHRG